MLIINTSVYLIIKYSLTETKKKTNFIIPSWFVSISQYNYV